MSKRKLLLADDSVTIQKVVNLTFADEGIEVISVGDGDSAMAKVVELGPDLVMADVNMPGLSGYQICEQIRQDEGLRQTPVILLVGSFEPFDEDEARRVGADDFLTKPFQSIRQLVNKVTVLLNSEQTKNGGQAENAPTKDYEDTLEMEQTIHDMPFPEPPQYEDGGFDDEMIQTSQVAGYTFDEASKFETKGPLAGEEADFAKTQPLTHEELREFNLSEPSLQDKLNESDELVGSFEPESSSEESGPVETLTTESESAEYQAGVDYEIHQDFPQNGPDTDTEAEVPEKAGSYDTESEMDEAVDYEAAGETGTMTETPAEAEEPVEVQDESTGEPAETAQAVESPELEVGQEDEMPLPEVASVLESDEDDLLELPPIETDYDDDSEDEEEVETGQAAALAQPLAETSVVADQISPELIEAIVNKVMEKLSEKAVKEVAWEVVPQMTELIVKKMAEEKLKD